VRDTLPLGSVGYEPQLSAKGERLIWIERAQADKLSALRGPGESYSDVILRLVELEAPLSSSKGGREASLAAAGSGSLTVLSPAGSIGPARAFIARLPANALSP
jgi:hypothetical protein